jgi:hypothetical protein
MVGDEGGRQELSGVRCAVWMVFVEEEEEEEERRICLRSTA